MKLLTTVLLVLIVTGCASTKMTEAGAHVRVVDSENADFLNECRFIQAINKNVAAVWIPELGNAGVRAELRNKAAELGGNVIIYTAGDADGLTAHGSADVYYCE